MNLNNKNTNTEKFLLSYVVVQILIAADNRNISEKNRGEINVGSDGNWLNFSFFIAVEYNILTVITPTAVFIEAVDGNFKIFITPLLRRRCRINNSVWLWVINSVRFAVYKT